MCVCVCVCVFVCARTCVRVVVRVPDVAGRMQAVTPSLACGAEMLLTTLSRKVRGGRDGGLRGARETGRAW